MALILNIDCATDSASVGFSKEGEIFALKENGQQKEHASFLQVAIKSLVAETGISLNEIDAVAVTSGPGSYTGLRVGLASAKGICYALNKQLITINTLEAMSQAALTHLDALKIPYNSAMLCPMIDARRMEVFTAIYDTNLEIILPPCAIEITNISFKSTLHQSHAYFFGSGASKSVEHLQRDNTIYLNVMYNVREVAILSKKAYENENFSNIAHSEPFYLKDFYSTQKP